MNYRLIASITGVVLMIEGAFMLLPMGVGLMYGEKSALWFLVTALISAACGVGLFKLRAKKKTMYVREGFVITALSWVIISLVGALPFTFSGQIPNYLDAVFETVSGFTTTGASILTDVEALDKGMLFWRSLTHWIGGMGILVFMLIIVRFTGGEANHLLRAESPGPNVSKMVSSMRKSAGILYGIYIALTVILILLLIIFGMPVFDAFCISFGTAGTGGFGVLADSMASYSPAIRNIVAVGMLVFGVNFNVYFLLLMRKWKTAFKNTELFAYIGIIAFSVIAITVNIMPMFGPSLGLHEAFFAVSSVITTTGFGSADFNLWPELSRCILVLLMFCGACAGSTGGGIKVSRLVILARAASFEVRKVLHPRSVKVLTLDRKPISRETVTGVQGYMTVYIAITALSTLVVALDSFDMVTTFTSVVATLNNIGPGLGLVGPTGNFAMFSPVSKVVLSLNMLFGRLELFPMLILLLPSTWKRN